MTRKQLFLRNALILTCGSLLLRFLNIGFRSYITQQISAQGMGLYQLIFSLFVLSSTLCTSGAGFAATRLPEAKMPPMCYESAVFWLWPSAFLRPFC